MLSVALPATSASWAGGGQNGSPPISLVQGSFRACSGGVSGWRRWASRNSRRTDASSPAVSAMWPQNSSEHTEYTRPPNKATEGVGGFRSWQHSSHLSKRRTPSTHNLKHAGGLLGVFVKLSHERTSLFSNFLKASTTGPCRVIGVHIKGVLFGVLGEHEAWRATTKRPQT